MRQQDHPDLSLWLREAKYLHKKAKSTSISESLPVLRRLINSNILQGLSLPELKAQNHIVQRKHLLNMLACENNCKNWREFKRKIESSAQGYYLPYSVELKRAGYPVLWFSDELQAQQYVIENGGKVVKVEKQAAVVPE